MSWSFILIKPIRIILNNSFAHVFKGPMVSLSVLNPFYTLYQVWQGLKSATLNFLNKLTWYYSIAFSMFKSVPWWICLLKMECFSDLSCHLSRDFDPTHSVFYFIFLLFPSFISIVRFHTVWYLTLFFSINPLLNLIPNMFPSPHLQ